MIHVNLKIVSKFIINMNVYFFFIIYNVDYLRDKSLYKFSKIVANNSETITGIPTVKIDFNNELFIQYLREISKTVYNVICKYLGFDWIFAHVSPVKSENPLKTFYPSSLNKDSCCKM